MSEKKFTPGPWMVTTKGIGPTSSEDDQSFGMVCPVAYIEEIDWPDNHKANARLIAASPDLLAVAEKLFAHAMSGAPFNYPAGSVQELEAAIAKALGE